MKTSPRRGVRALALAALVLAATLSSAHADHHDGGHIGAGARGPRGGGDFVAAGDKSVSRAQRKVNKAYDKASEAVALADAKLIVTKVKSAADVKATVAQGRASVASAALGAATQAKALPFVLIPGPLGNNARVEVQQAATRLVASAVNAKEDKAEAIAEAVQAVDAAAQKKAAMVLKADATLDKAVARAQKKHKTLPGTGVAAPAFVPAVAPIVTPKVVDKKAIGGGGLFGGVFPKAAALTNPLAGLGAGLGFGAGLAQPKKAFGFGRRLMAAEQPQHLRLEVPVQALEQPEHQLAPLQQADNADPVTSGLAAFANAAVAFGSQLQQFAALAQQQRADGLRPEAGAYQQQQQQPYYNYNSNNPLGQALAGPFAAPVAAAPSALSPRAQATIGAISSAAGLALNAAAPLVRGVASAVPVMVPAVNGDCASGKRVRVEGQGVFCVLGSWEPAAQALMNGAGLATAAAGPAAAGVANLMAATRPAAGRPSRGSQN